MRSDKSKKDNTDKLLRQALQAKHVHVPEGFASTVLGHVHDEKIHETLVKAIRVERAIAFGGLVVLGFFAVLLLFPELVTSNPGRIQDFWLVAPLLGSKAGTNILSFLGLGSVLVYTVYILTDLLLVE